MLRGSVDPREASRNSSPRSPPSQPPPATAQPRPHDSQNLNSLSFGADRERRLERDRELHLAAAAARAEIAREDAAVMRLQDAARQSARARRASEEALPSPPPLSAPCSPPYSSAPSTGGRAGAADDTPEPGELAGWEANPMEC